jgi:tetratricopeptide (TPR) repeat protein
VFVSGWLTISAVAYAAESAAMHGTSTLDKAEDLYKRTEFEASLALLDKHSTEAATLFLLGRNYFMLADFKKSADYLGKAVQANPHSSDYSDWLGRAYGKRAETGNPLAAPGYATKARQAFEQAVALDGRNSDALSDLFDYYLDAPGFLGGGYDKAANIAEKISAVDPPEGYFEQAKLAQKRREFDTAERHLLRAIAATPQKVSGLLEYAKFLASQGRNRESDAILLKAEQLHPNSPRVWYTRADILVHQHRDLSQAKDLLQRYLQSAITVDDPSKQDAARLLRQANGA